MSIQYCHQCQTHIDTDFDAEHFEGVCEVCEKETGCDNVDLCKFCELKPTHTEIVEYLVNDCGLDANDFDGMTAKQVWGYVEDKEGFEI